MEGQLLDENLELPKSASLANAHHILSLKSDYNELHKKVKNGRVALYCLVGFTLLGAIIETAQSNFEPLVLGINAVVIFLMIVCVILVQSRPHLGLSIAVVLVLVIMALIAIGDPTHILRGLFVRVIILYYMIVAISSSKEYTRVEKELKKYGIDPGPSYYN